MGTLDPNNIPGAELQRQQQRLQQRQWGPAEAELLAEIRVCEKAAQAAAHAARAAAQDAAQDAVKEIKAAYSVAKIAEALAEPLAEIHKATQKSLKDAAEIATARTRAVMDIEAATQTQIGKIEQLVLDRLASLSLPPPDLAPIDLDETYSEKDLASASLDSIMWVAFECRRMMVRHGFGYRVDYSRATRKPPTALAMWMAEHYVNYPEKLDRLFQRVTRPNATAAEKPTRTEPRPQSQDERDCEAYMRSAGLLPPEGKTQSQ